MQHKPLPSSTSVALTLSRPVAEGQHTGQPGAHTATGAHMEAEGRGRKPAWPSEHDVCEQLRPTHSAVGSGPEEGAAQSSLSTLVPLGAG